MSNHIYPEPGNKYPGPQVHSYISSLALVTISFFLSFSCNSTNSEVVLKGELKKWHKITLIMTGPESSELDDNNPFLNYRLDATFTNGDKSYEVPGFYGADGNAAESSASAGNKWMVRFTPDEVGEWQYHISFKKGDNIAVLNSPKSHESAGFMDGAQGVFTVVANDKAGLDNRAKGRLKYVGEPYLKYSESEKYFIKVGVDAPENLLGYIDFDASTDVFDLRKDWHYHSHDFTEKGNDYLWKDGKGKNLIGAIQYLASEGLNVFSFLTFNVDGDDRNIFPHILKVSAGDYKNYADIKPNKNAWDSLFHKTRFDVSKLDQWERIFAFAETQGMFLHFKTQETETDHLMDGGVFGTEGKLYYRELIARYGHHLSLNWNLGEENNQPIDEVLKVANYISDIDSYNHHMVIHTFPNQDDRYSDLIGDQSPLTGASLQLSDPEFHDVHPRVLKWRQAAQETGKPWALAVDEPGKANIALLPDEEDPDHDLARQNALWGTLMAGGYGVEWYFGYQSPHSDLTCQDFRSRDLFWDQNRHARQFFENHIPFWQMTPADHLTRDQSSYCLTSDEVIVIYIKNGARETIIDLGNTERKFSIKWYDPKMGGVLQDGTLTQVGGKGTVSIGLPPGERSKDWVALLVII